MAKIEVECRGSLTEKRFKQIFQKQWKVSR